MQKAITSTPSKGRALLERRPHTNVVDVSDISHLEGDALRRVLVERANALRPLLESNAAATEAGRRVVDENVSAIREAVFSRS